MGVLVSLTFLVLGGLGVLRWRTGDYRAGPWPGLTARGGGLLLACAALLGGIHGLIGEPRRAWPDLLLLALSTLAPLLLATRMMRVPGAASAVCGAFLLPRSLASLVEPGLEPPALLLVPSVVFDVLVWGRHSDVVSLAGLVPGPRPRRGRRVKATRRLSAWRVALAGAAYGAVLTAVVPPWATLLGRVDWNAGETLATGAVAAVLCGALSLLAAGGPDRGSQPTPVPTG